MYYTKADYDKDMAKQRVATMWREIGEWAGFLLARWFDLAHARGPIARAFKELRRIEDWARGLIHACVYVELLPFLKIGVDEGDIRTPARRVAMHSTPRAPQQTYRFNPCVGALNVLRESAAPNAKSNAPPARDFTAADAARRLDLLRQALKEIAAIAADPHAYAEKVALRVLRASSATIYRRQAPAREEHASERNDIWRENRAHAHAFLLSLETRDTS